MHTLPFRHPLATRHAGAVIGYRVDGRPIYAIAGGSGEGEGAAGTGQQPAAETPKPGAAPAAKSATPAGDRWSGFRWDGKVESLPADVAKVIREAREEAGKSRATAKENAATQARQELAQTIGKALGIVQDDKPADPAELTRTITEKTSRIGELETTVRTQAIELAAYRAAGNHQADAGALLDSRSFIKSVEGLDPADKDFTTKLDEAIKTAVENNPQLRTGQAPRRGGGDFAGGPGTQQRPTSLHDAIAARLGG
ncbi:hypothetical protein [Streptomyces sp. DH12]|uniref:hypothetical protein n=1 Tax=Streptomyces sp. DH12 TaxID=2857010 RepID=UPI001E51BFF9|nr:hypothetical protein [Streptomyces sp. DH12]